MRSLNNKDLIKDDSKIRNCGSNIAKMTTLEHIYCKLFVWKIIQSNFYYCIIDCIKEMYEGFKSLLILLLNILLIPLYPIILPIQSYKSIQEAKEKADKRKMANNEMAKRFGD